MSLNRVEIIGHLGRDPETRHTQAGNAIVNLNVAVSETWKDRAGEKQKRTEWVRVVIFNEKLGEIADKYLRKGSQVYLAGKMQTRKWTDQQGVEKYTTEVVLPKFGGEIVLLGSRQDEKRRPAESRPEKDIDYGAELDDQIPFD